MSSLKVAMEDLRNQRAAIAGSVDGQGVEASDGDTLAQLAGKITQIEGGGGSVEASQIDIIMPRARYTWLGHGGANVFEPGKLIGNQTSIANELVLNVSPVTKAMQESGSTDEAFSFYQQLAQISAMQSTAKEYVRIILVDVTNKNVHICPVRSIQLMGATTGVKLTVYNATALSITGIPAGGEVDMIYAIDFDQMAVDIEDARGYADTAYYEAAQAWQRAEEAYWLADNANGEIYNLQSQIENLEYAVYELQEQINNL